MQGPMEDRQVLESWKEISAHLRRGVRTCQNWEHDLGLPIHRLDGTPKARVFAYTDELDRWIEEKLGHYEPELRNPEIKTRVSWKKFVVPALGTLGIAFIALVIWRFVIQPPAPHFPAAKPMIAVLYLKNNSGDPTLDNWRENLPTLLAAGLGQSRYLRILDDLTVYGILKKLDLLKSEKYTLDELKNVAAEGGATHLLSGNYFTAGGKFVINLSLVDAKTGTVVNSMEEEAPNKDAIFNSVDSLAKKIQVALNIPEQLMEEGTYKMVGEVYTRNPQALQSYVEGVKAQNLMDWDKAIPAFEKAVDLDPRFAMAYRALGAMYGAQLNYVKEFQNKRKAYDLRDKVPERERLFIEGTWFSLREQTHLKAYSTFKKLVALYPDDYYARFALAFLIDDPDEKIREYEYLHHSQTQSQIQKQSVFLYGNLAFSYCAKGDYIKARTCWEEAVNNLPPDPSRHVQLAGHFALEKNLDAALRECEKAAALAPNDLFFKSLVANIDWIKENPDKALETIGSLLKGQKDPSMLDGWRSSLFMIKGKFKEALDIDERGEKSALSQGGSNVDLGQTLRLRGYNLLQMGSPEKAFEKFRAGLEYIKKEEDKLPWKDFGDLPHERRISLIWQICALCDMGRVGEAETLYREYEPLIPNYNRKKSWPICYCSIGALPAGKIALAKKDGFTAIKKMEECLGEMYAEIVNVRSIHAYVLDALGDAYQLGGRLDKAAETYARIRQLLMGRSNWGAVYARSYYKLAKVYEQMGKKAEAGERYRKFLELWKDADSGLPEVEDAKRRLAVLQN